MKFVEDPVRNKELEQVFFRNIDLEARAYPLLAAQYVDLYTVDELAEIIGVSASTVDRKIAAEKKQLLADLERMEAWEIAHPE